MAERPLRAYNGDESYIFVAYSHEDSELVFPQIRWLQDHGFNIAWDEGISPGAAWRSEIAEAIRGCSLLLFFTTPNSVASEHCTREVNFALDEHHRPVLAVHLLETVLPDAVALSLSDRQAILQHALEPEDYERKLVSAVATYLNQPLPEISLPAPSKKSAQQRSWSFALVCSLVVGSIVAGLVTWLGNSLNTPSQTGIQLPLSLQNFWHYPGASGGPNKLSLSPDGRQIAYIGLENGETYLYAQNMNAHKNVKYPETNGASNPFFSPDGKWIGFYTRGRFKRVPAAGGKPVDIGSIPDLKSRVGWGDNGYIMFTTGYRSPLSQITEVGGEITAVTSNIDGESHRDPFVLPGSKAVLYVSNAYPKKDEIWAKDLITGESQFLIFGSDPQYSNGKLLFCRCLQDIGAIWVVDFNPDTLTILSEPEPLFEDTKSSFAISNTGALVFSRVASFETRLLQLNTLTDETRIISAELTNAMRLSPDGQSLAVARTHNGLTNIWIYDLQGKRSEKQLSFDGGTWPVWSPSGTEIAYFKFGTGVVTQEMDSPAPPKTLIEFDKNGWLLQWSTEGILYMKINNITQGDIYLAANNGDQRVIKNEHFAEVAAQISPDGAWLAWTRVEAGESQVWIEPFPEGGSRLRVDVPHGEWPKWSADGTALYVTSFNRLMRVPVTSGSGMTLGEPAIVRHLGSPSGISFDMYDVSADERRIILMDVTYPDPPVVVLETNWPRLLLD